MKAPLSYRIGLIAFAVGLACFVGMSVYAIGQLQSDLASGKFTIDEPAVLAPQPKLETKIEPKTEPVADPDIHVAMPAQAAPVVVPQTTSKQNLRPVDNSPEPMERIPFTAAPVTPGDGESYRGTYGQCPFYENAGEKGCFPPSDLTCNADWSYCEPKSITTNQEDAL